MVTLLESIKGTCGSNVSSHSTTLDNGCSWGGLLSDNDFVWDEAVWLPVLSVSWTDSEGSVWTDTDLFSVICWLLGIETPSEGCPLESEQRY